MIRGNQGKSIFGLSGPEPSRENVIYPDEEDACVGPIFNLLLLKMRSPFAPEKGVYL